MCCGRFPLKFPSSKSCCHSDVVKWTPPPPPLVDDAQGWGRVGRPLALVEAATSPGAAQGLVAAGVRG